MIEKMILGRFISGNSYVHRLDPRTKLLSAFYFILIIFLANNWQSYLLLTVFTLLAVFFSEINLSFFLRGLKPMILLILMTVALQIFFTKGGTVYFSWGFFCLTSKGLISGAFIFTRFLLIIFMSTLMTLTTQPLAMGDAVEFFLRPLKIVKFPVHEVSLMLSIALRFVPTLMDETEKIMKAQRARGVDFNDGNLIRRMKSLVPLLVPLFVSSFKRADELATAMEARGYRGDFNRTRYRRLQWNFRDTLVLLIFGLLTFFLMLARSS